MSSVIAEVNSVIAEVNSVATDVNSVATDVNSVATEVNRTKQCSAEVSSAQQNSTQPGVSIRINNNCI